MPAILSIILSNATSDLTFEGGGRTRPLIVRRMDQARRMRLSVDPRDGGVRLILPRRASIRDALHWVEGQRPWVEKALAALPAPQPIRAGETLLVGGDPLLIEIAPRGVRGVRREDGRLLVAGPTELIANRILRWLKAHAADQLTVETRHYADRAGVTIGRISIGDPRARWGSCSSTGDIRYSWRLILAPPEVLESTVAHEVAHRTHMDHSPEFHGHVRGLLGRDPTAERAWLRAHGSALYWLGRDS
jgi:predicted metal-dependent hydrolase